MFDPLRWSGFCGFYDNDEWEALQARKAADRVANQLIIPDADPLMRMDPVIAFSLWKRIHALHRGLESFDAYVSRNKNLVYPPEISAEKKSKGNRPQTRGPHAGRLCNGLCPQGRARDA
jgi:hypothetical protein